jgi:hypothetical protein
MRSTAAERARPRTPPRPHLSPRLGPARLAPLPRQARYGGELESFYPVLATHWKRASLDGEALRYLELCSQLALKHYANHEAVGFLQEMLEIVHKCSPSERAQLGLTAERHATFAELLSEAALRIGLLGTATEAVELLFAVVQMPLPTGSPARQQALLALEFAWATLPARARALVPNAIRRAPSNRRLVELSARGYQIASRVFYYSGCASRAGSPCLSRGLASRFAASASAAAFQAALASRRRGRLAV